MKNAKHIVKTVLFCGMLAVFSAVSVFSPKEKGSFYENRRLAVFPVPSVETVLDGTFFYTVRLSVHSRAEQCFAVQISVVPHVRHLHG